MEVIAYKLTCLTNLHMGGSGTNLGVIDLEVERDPILGEPTMNASGVKGALRDHCEALMACQEDPDGDGDIRKVFGTSSSGDTAGAYAFFQGDLLARPVRISKGTGSYLLATSRELIENFTEKLWEFCWDGWQEELWGETLPALPKGDKVITNADGCHGVEGFQVAKAESKLLDRLLGEKKWVLMSAEQLRSIALPVVTHNVLRNGTSANLWFEEYVPHHSVFGLLIGRPNGDETFREILTCMEERDKDQFGEEILYRNVIQFGAEASTGCGYVRMEEIKCEQKGNRGPV